jgi:hypothetical protein
MAQYIAGPGLSLPYPQNLYPSELYGAPADAATNKITLAPGDTLPIPAGDWFVNLSQYLVMQFLDPITNTWSIGPNAAWNGGHQFVISDGFNVRVANLLGCPISATVTAPGNGSYVQATTTIAATGGTSTWVPIIGGAFGASILGYGAGYGVAPEVFIPAPPPASNNVNGVGGVPATAWANIASGTVNGITFTNPGAGYPSGVTVVLVPSATDPNLSTGITNATVWFSLVNAGSITGVLCTNPGAALATVANITLTVAGAGANGTVTANVLQTVTAASVSGYGAGYGTTAVLLTTVGGVPSAGSIGQNPDGLGLAWRPRPAQIGLAPTGATGCLAAQVGTIYDGGLFLGSTAPSFVLSTVPVTAGSLVSVTGATIALTMGSRADIVTLQPAP